MMHLMIQVPEQPIVLEQAPSSSFQPNNAGFRTVDNPSNETLK